jgi:plastocyanin
MHGVGRHRSETCVGNQIGKLILNESRKDKTMKRRTVCAAGLVMVVTAMTLFAVMQSATVNAQQSSAGRAEVKIDNFSFGPGTLTVPVGTTVTWTNRDDIPHTVLSTEGAFKSKVLDTDDKFSFTFNKPGEYSYFCSVHPKMTGKVVVQ